jgi:MinD-like ATPase involved in chromosome partitioning or flagellar assembly
MYASEWDTQVPVPTIEDMWQGLQNGTLSTDTSLVIFSDAYLEDYSDDLATAIATFAPEALVLCLFYDMDNYTRLNGLVAAKARSLGLPVAKFYPVSAQGEIGQEIYDAFVSYDEDIRNNRQLMEQVIQQELAPEVEPQPEPEVSSGFAGSQRGLIFASTSSKGGSGKTTVAICTASMIYHSSRLAAERGARERPLSVCLVDMDTRDGQIGFLLGQTTPTALNIFVAPKKDVETIREHLIYDERLGIHVLLAPKRARTADYLTPEFYQDIIQKLSTMFDVVILDTSVNYLDPLLGSVVLPISDAVMFVTNLSIGSVYGMNRWMDEVTSPADAGGSGISKEKIGVVINQSAPDLGIDQELLEHAAAGARLLVAIPLDSAAVISASNHNRLSDIVMFHPDISPAYYAIARQVLPNEPLIAPLDVNGGDVAGGSRTPTASNGGTPVAAATKKKRGLFK